MPLPSRSIKLICKDKGSNDCYWEKWKNQSGIFVSDQTLPNQKATVNRMGFSLILTDLLLFWFKHNVFIQACYNMSLITSLPSANTLVHLLSQLELWFIIYSPVNHGAMQFTVWMNINPIIWSFTLHLFLQMNDLNCLLHWAQKTTIRNVPIKKVFLKNHSWFDFL